MKEILKKILDEYGVNHYYYGVKKYDLQQKLIDLTPYLDDGVKSKERFYCVLNGIYDNPLCIVKSCKNKPKFKNISHGYHTFCSSKCSEQYKRETTDENGVLLAIIIGEKIRKDKTSIMSNGKTKGQNARNKQLCKLKENNYEFC